MRPSGQFCAGTGMLHGARQAGQCCSAGHNDFGACFTPNRCAAPSSAVFLIEFVVSAAFLEKPATGLQSAAVEVPSERILPRKRRSLFCRGSLHRPRWLYKSWSVSRIRSTQKKLLGLLYSCSQEERLNLDDATLNTFAEVHGLAALRRNLKPLLGMVLL